jgi:hypothetical protein
MFSGDAKMDPTVLAAWIGLGGTIAGGVVGAVLPSYLNRKALARNAAYDKVTGSILRPEPHAAAKKTLDCSGNVSGLEPGLTLWLAVEVGEFVWPKEGRIVPDKDNKWTATVFEDGRSPVFDVALFVTDAAADKRIKDWLEEGKRTGTYANLRGIEGARRLARVDGLRIESKP